MKLTDSENSWDRLLKIHTTGRDDSEADTFYYPYEATPYAVLERLSESGYIRKKDRLLDYGCGKGRVSFFLSAQTKCFSTGVEFSERLFGTALKNRETAVSSGRTEFVKCDARDYTVSPGVNRFFFFNPFSSEILKSVMKQVIASYYEEPRKMLLFFYYPSDAYIAYLMTVPELRFFDEIDCSDLFEEHPERERILIFETADR